MIHATVTVSRKPSVGIRTPKHIHVTNAIRNIKAVTSVPYYDGEYVVTPRAWNETILPTKEKQMRDDVTVLRVPYYETHNDKDGMTAYIANEV